MVERLDRDRDSDLVCWTFSSDEIGLAELLDTPRIILGIFSIALFPYLSLLMLKPGHLMILCHNYAGFGLVFYVYHFRICVFLYLFLSAFVDGEEEEVPSASETFRCMICPLSAPLQGTRGDCPSTLQPS